MRRVVAAVLVGVAAVAAAGCGSDDPGVSGDQTLRNARAVWTQEWPDDWPCRYTGQEWADVVERNPTGDPDIDAAFLLVHYERCGAASGG